MKQIDKLHKWLKNVECERIIILAQHEATREYLIHRIINIRKKNHTIILEIDCDTVIANWMYAQLLEEYLNETGLYNSNDYFLSHLIERC